MCDVLFITPYVKSQFKGEPFGTLQLATILKNNGIKCKVISFGRMGNVHNFDDFMKNAITKLLLSTTEGLLSF